jgi:inner membrane protein
MDNVCHTLVGAALGEAGLKRTTRFGMPVLMIAANLPDVDALAFVADVPAVALRRGWTHGVLAQVLLPVLFTGLVLAIDRLWRPQRGAPAARVVPLLVLGYAGVLSHVFLDWLNTYGIRLLMPFSPRWFYGDAVFIVDPWLWLSLGAGVFLSRRWRVWRPAAITLLLATIYIGAMLWSARTARTAVMDAWIDARGGPPQALMVGPVAANPFRRSIIVDAGDHYERGRLRWWPTRVTFDVRVPKNANDPAVARARTDRDVGAILVWARFPYYELQRVDGGIRVTVHDMRFGSRGLGSASVLLRD